MRGVELALEGGEASLLAVFSDGAKEGLVGVRVRREEESVSTSWLALMAFSNEAGLMDCVPFLARGFCTLLTGPEEGEVTDWACALSEGQAHSDVFGIV